MQPDAFLSLIFIFNIFEKSCVDCDFFAPFIEPLGLRHPDFRLFSRRYFWSLMGMLQKWWIHFNFSKANEPTWCYCFRLRIFFISRFLRVLSSSILITRHGSLHHSQATIKSRRYLLKLNYYLKSIKLQWLRIVFGHQTLNAVSAPLSATECHTILI